MKTQMVFDEEHLIYCSYGQADGPDDFNKDCECFEDDKFREYFITKYPNHLASIAQRDKDIKEIYGK